MGKTHGPHSRCKNYSRCEVKKVISFSNEHTSAVVRCLGIPGWRAMLSGRNLYHSWLIVDDTSERCIVAHHLYTLNVDYTIEKLNPEDDYYRYDDHEYWNKIWRQYN